MNKSLLYSIMLIMNNAQDNNKRKRFLELMIEAKNSCLQEIDDVYIEAEKVIDTYLKDQSKK